MQRTDDGLEAAADVRLRPAQGRQSVCREQALGRPKVVTPQHQIVQQIDGARQLCRRQVCQECLSGSIDVCHLRIDGQELSG